VNILIFGAQGQVGSDLTKQLQQRGDNLICPGRAQLDFSQADAVGNFITSKRPDLVINCCAYTAVDKAESDVEVADAVNHMGVAAMAEACAKLAIPAIHISTDYVYAGDGVTPYLESAATGPLGIYGKTKLDGDLALAKILDKHIILRTSWVFGEYGNNFVKTMLRVSQNRSELSVVADQTGRPTYAGDIVASIIAFVRAIEEGVDISWGIYHCASEGITTWHGFACEIFAQAAELGIITQSPVVNAITTADYPTAAPRPAYSVLNTDKLTAFMGQPLPHWRVGLGQLLHHLKQN